MGNSLNNAFVRAYAKDRQAQQPHEPSVTVVHSTNPKLVAVTGQILAPTTAHASAAPHPVAKTLAPAKSVSVSVNRAAHNPSPTVSAATTRIQAAPVQASPSQAVHPRGTPSQASLASHLARQSTSNTHPRPASSPLPGLRREAISPEQHEEVVSVFRRIDQAAAAPFAAPHVGSRPSAQVSVGVGAPGNNVARRLQASGPIPTAPQQLVPRPKLAEETREPEVPPAAVSMPLQTDADSRRKSVMDYLYAAGQVSTRPLPIQTAVSGGTDSLASALAMEQLVSSSIVDAWNGSSSQAASPKTASFIRSDATQDDDSASIAVSFAQAATKSAPVPMVDHYPQKPPSKMFTGRATSATLNVGSTQQNVVLREPAVAHVHQSEIRSRPGEILRVDVPPGAVSDAKASPKISSDMQAAPQPSLEPAKQTAETVSKSQDPPERAAEVERNLRMAKTRIFNPVWEVDELQWPHVCRQLLQQRAASLAEVAEKLKAACQDGLEVLGITSSQPGEGTTTVASCLALLCAQHGLKVVLIDGNVGAPSLCTQTNLETENDWRTSIVEKLPLEEIAVHSITDQLTLIPLHGETGRMRKEILPSDQRIADMIRELSDSFDLVIVDVGSINASSALITNLARENVFDAAMVVVDRRRSEQNAVDNCIIRIQHTGISSIGIVENFAA